MGFFQEGSESFPVETALKNSCSVKVAICKKQSGTCSPKDTPQEKEEMRLEVLALRRALMLPDAVQCPALLPWVLQPKTVLLSRETQTLHDLPGSVLGTSIRTCWFHQVGIFNDSVGTSRFELSFP